VVDEQKTGEQNKEEEGCAALTLCVSRLVTLRKLSTEL
jgi:hypothetical protein